MKKTDIETKVGKVHLKADAPLNRANAKGVPTYLVRSFKDVPAAESAADIPKLEKALREWHGKQKPVVQKAVDVDELVKIHERVNEAIALWLKRPGRTMILDLFGTEKAKAENTKADTSDAEDFGS